MAAGSRGGHTWADRGRLSVTIEFIGLRKSFRGSRGTEITVLDGISFDIEERSLTSIMGPSGCGKTTLLNIIAGLIEPDAGTIRRNGSEIAPGELPYAYVFQEPRLLNWLTVEENIEFALKSVGVPTAEHDERVRKYLAMVDLEGEEDTYPLQLSGGMRQRVGLARALAVEKDILLMDEPFSALDEITAQNLRNDVVDLWQQTDKTIVFITHNISEAVFLSDRILFMNNVGEIFYQAEIDVERPRLFQDEELKRIEADLMDRFFSHVATD